MSDAKLGGQGGRAPESWRPGERFVPGEKVPRSDELPAGQSLRAPLQQEPPKEDFGHQTLTAFECPMLISLRGKTLVATISELAQMKPILLVASLPDAQAQSETIHKRTEFRLSRIYLDSRQAVRDETGAIDVERTCNELQKCLDRNCETSLAIIFDSQDPMSDSIRQAFTARGVRVVGFSGADISKTWSGTDPISNYKKP